MVIILSSPYLGDQPIVLPIAHSLSHEACMALLARYVPHLEYRWTFGERVRVECVPEQGPRRLTSF